MNRGRDAVRIIQSSIDIKQWIEAPPSSDEVRPARDPVCGVASRPAGGALRIYGHGRRRRMCQGPRAPGERPVGLSVLCRRYQCQACGALLLVVPCGVARRKHYALSAMAWAVALLGVAGWTYKAVRQAVSVWPLPNGDVVSTWKSLRRWIADIARGELFAGLPAGPAGASARQIAERAAMAIAGHAPPTGRGLPVPHLAFLGSVHMA